MNLRFDDPFPEGLGILVNWTEVAGIQFRKPDALAFAKGKDQRVEFEAEPDNEHDPNAIKVIGVWKGWFFTKRRMLGYLEREVAEEIHERQAVNEIVPRLRQIYLGHNDFIRVKVYVLAPKQERKAKKNRKTDG